MRRAAAVGLALAVGLLAGGCVYYPKVTDIGGVRLLPSKGRVVREGARALFYADIDSTDDADLAVHHLHLIGRSFESLGRDLQHRFPRQIPELSLYLLQYRYQVRPLPAVRTEDFPCLLDSLVVFGFCCAHVFKLYTMVLTIEL